MMIRLPRSRASALYALGIALAVLLHLGLRLTFIAEPLERDEGFYATMAITLLDGGVPYRDAIDIKPPGITLIYAALIALGGEQLAAIRIGSAIYSALTLLALASVATAAGGRRIGLLAGGLFAVFGATPLLLANSANTEVFLGLPLLLWLSAVLHRRQWRWAPLIAGTGIALAMLIKPVVLPFALLGLLLARQRPAGHSAAAGMALYLAPGLLLAALIGGWFAAHGAWQDFWHWNVEVPFIYAAGAFVSGPTLAQSLTRYAGLLLAMLGFALPWSLHALWRNRRQGGSPASIVAASLGCAMLSFLLPGKNFAHYYILVIPFACLATAFTLDAMTALRPAARYLLLAGWLMAFGSFVLRSVPWHVGSTADEVSVNKYNTDLFVQIRTLSAELGRLSGPDERIFQWGFEPQLYFYSRRRPASRYLGNILLDMDDRGLKSPTVLRQDLDRHRPRFIVIVEGSKGLIGYPALRSYMNEQAYQPYAQLPYFEGQQQYRIGVYRRP